MIVNIICTTWLKRGWRSKRRTLFTFEASATKRPQSKKKAVRQPAFTRSNWLILAVRPRGFEPLTFGSGDR